MNSEVLQDDLIVRYLLGDLPETEQARLEDRAFADRATQQSIEDAENDLIDDYVCAALSAKERLQFESRFLASAERQRKVEFARALAQVVPAPTTKKTAQPIHWWESLRAFFSGLTPAYQVGLIGLATAALLLALGVPWLIAQSMGLRTQVAQLQAQQQSAEAAQRQQLAEQQRRNEELTQQLQSERSQLAQLQEELAQVVRPVIAALVLLPGIARGATRQPQLLILPDAQQARLQIGLERGDEYPRYRIELRTAAGRAILRRENLTARNGKVVLLLPAAALNAGDYDLALKGVHGNEVLDLGYYYFKVSRP
ncbi:MAG: hypothetical protein HOP19_11550 [Acidobacteria bacterium]|nr:hypothetical protein [Acidobacteriota bacterium]